MSAMRSMLPDKDVRVRKIRIPTPHGSIPALILSPRTAPADATGVLWIHGGGYIAGMKEMVHMSRAVDLVKKFGAVCCLRDTGSLPSRRIRRRWTTAMRRLFI